MAKFKCINCGHIKENINKSSCSRCGYTMYEMPYDRKTLLLNECKRFWKAVLFPCVKNEHFTYYRTEMDFDTGKERIIYKSNDDARFPEFDAIKKYILSARTSELAIARSRESLSKIKAYISTQYQQVYQTSFERVYKLIEETDNNVEASLKALGYEYTPERIEIPPVTLQYTETPDIELLELSHRLIDLLDLLIDKMTKYIKQNNAYGAIKPLDEDQKAFSDNYFRHKDYAIQEQIIKIEEVLSKSFIIDIFSNGYEELYEMLDAFFCAIYTLLKCSALDCAYYYQFDDGDYISGEGFLEKINIILSARYDKTRFDIKRVFNEKEFDEENLFDIYDSLIELDKFRIFNSNKTRRVRVGLHHRKLEALIGLESVKETVRKIDAYAEANKSNGDLNLHMCFYGNPGTGKTEVARIIAGILCEIGVLPSNRVVEVDRSDLVGAYIGETAIKTTKVIENALGGVLFVDEAYSLAYSEAKTDYGHEAIATLIKAMEDKRGKFCVIFAGYRTPMLEMISSNPGFRSRIQFELDFPNYSRKELGDIADSMIKSRDYVLTEEAKNLILDVTDFKRKELDFANAREVRNILDHMIMCQNLRALSADDREIGLVDAKKYISDMGIPLHPTEDAFVPKVLSAEEELEALIGLGSVKRMVKKIRAYAKRNKDDESFNVHMCFYGNPGTGKTEVARIISRLLYEAGVLPEAKLVETDAHGLIGKYVGETAGKTEAKIADAMGGVLFIDEAYSLCDAKNEVSGVGYGDEAIAVLLKNMEDKRGKFCVVLAGYREEIHRMISSNPGLESRIQFTLEFPDYTREELGEIAVNFAAKKKYVLENAALERILDVAEYYRGRPNFANARTVRNVLDQVIMNQNVRTEDDEVDNTIVLQDVEDYISDEKITSFHSGRRIGFY